MSTELGHFALILAFCLTLPQAFFGLAGAHRRREPWMALASRAAIGHLVFVAMAFACLTYSFLQDDFSTLYVASHSNSQLPTFYKFTAVWGAHEGSLLLWLLAQALWTFTVVAFSRNLPHVVSARVVGVLGLISAGFALFVLLTSSPFERLWPAAADGRDLNPLLQDPGLAFHPPMQYFGYVGMSVPFAFAIAAMLAGKLDSTWARWVRPWAIGAWIFLTFGITLGSWWAYYELGWGGWWFWVLSWCAPASSNPCMRSRTIPSAACSFSRSWASASAPRSACMRGARRCSVRTPASRRSRASRCCC